jgi:Domain of unknown function (DUF4350)
MKERLITLLCACGSLVLFLTMFVHGENGNGGGETSRPTTAERGPNGYRAAQGWLEVERIRTRSLRDGFDTLTRVPGLAPTGNVLIVTVPTVTAFRTQELRPLGRWVGAGNTLVVLAALSDNPDWAAASGSLAAGDLALLTGLDFEPQRRTAREPAASSVSSEPSMGSVSSEPGYVVTSARRQVLIPNRGHAYFAGVREASAVSAFPSRSWTVKIPYDGFVFTLAHDAETGAGVLWTRPSGAGGIIVSGFGSLFTNRLLGTADNARLLANIIGANLGPGGAVLFDDIHQGLGSVYDPAKFWSDHRLHVTIFILCLLWLLWVLGTTRLRVPVLPETIPSEADLVRATGGFLARVLTPVAAGRRMIERGSALRALDRHASLAPADVRQLRLWCQRLNESKRVPLLRLHNLLVRINRQLNS